MPVKTHPDVGVFLEEVEFRDAALLSFVTSAIIVPAYDEIHASYGIIRAEYLLLLCCSHFDALTAQDVSELTGRPRNSISRAVSRMVDVGYIEKTPDPSDGRQSILRITEKGYQLHKQVATLMQGEQENVLGALTDSERGTLVKLLRKIALGKVASVCG